MLENIPPYIHAWMATEDGAAKIGAILQQMVFDQAAPLCTIADVRERIEAAYRASTAADEFGRSPVESARDGLLMFLSIMERHGHVGDEIAEQVRGHIRTLVGDGAPR